MKYKSFWQVVLTVIVALLIFIRIVYRIERARKNDKQILTINEINKNEKPVLSEKQILKQDMKNFKSSEIYRNKFILSDTLIEVNSKTKLKLLEGMQSFPDLQNDTIPLIVYANNYILTVEKKKTNSNKSIIDQWNVPQHFSEDYLAFLPNRKVAAEEYITNTFTSGFKSPYGNRYVFTKYKEVDGYRYYISFSGPYEEYSKLNKFLKYYIID